MSGIAGIIHVDGRPVDGAQLQAMTAAMAYRGPDGTSQFVAGPVGLAHCAFHTTREARGERQPLASADGQRVLVFDGRLDEREELRAGLRSRDVTPRTGGDAELVLASYEAWGEKCLDHLTGDFSFCLWDGRARTAFLVRDRCGNRPLVYWRNGSTLAFASDVHALLRLHGVPSELDEEALAEMAVFDPRSAVRTLWSGVSRLPPAHAVSTDGASWAPRRYWEPESAPVLAYKDDADYVAHYRDVLFKAVHAMSRSDSAIACEASGGLDSSALFSILVHFSRTGQLQAPGVHGVALQFDAAESDESVYQQALCDHLQAPIEQFRPGEYTLDWYLDFARAFRSFPPMPNGAMLIPLHAASSAGGRRVVVSGIGGDEWLSGVSDYRATALRERRWRELAALLASESRRDGWACTLARLGRHGFLPLGPERLKRPLKQLLTRGLPQAEWVAPRLRELAAKARRADRSGEGADVVRTRLLEKLDCAAGLWWREITELQMAQTGVERRSPFWSRRVVETAFSMPEWLRVKDGLPKSVHRLAMRGLLPDAILERADKATFPCVLHTLRPALAAKLERRADGGHAQWIDARGVARALDLMKQSPSICVDFSVISILAAAAARA
ncbi:asparagine synthetase B family protein [Ramlibacter albus]|uniref:asparagine synthase (glutamine-hydrolyzing) n=1 Tax=Ramlibacter albus TaxID=2079448 RepID=A0A923S2E9_9BURK|nr:asparagine synthase-related protein [Ramlibacter albus]MBC5765305.1 hypothetical protein [Ramlibacter albus]